MDGFTYKTETNNVILNTDDFMLDSVVEKDNLYILDFKKKSGASLSMELYKCGKDVSISLKDNNFKFSVTEFVSWNYSTKKYTLSSKPSLDLVCEYAKDCGLMIIMN